MIKTIFAMTALSLSLLWGGSFSWQESVPVVRSEPVYRYVTIRRPYEICQNRRVRVYQEDEGQVPVAALMGAVAGGVLGHQFGRGHGREAATIGGAVVGALGAANLVQNHPRSRWENRRVCETRYEEHRERHLIHYKNIAWYQGRRIVKFSRHPLKRIRVNVRVSY